MNTEAKSKWQMRFATLGIFLIGVVTGALALNAFELWFGASKSQSRREKYEAVFSDLKLTEEQKTQIEKIWAETRDNIQKMRQDSEPRIQEIRSQHDEKIQKILTPDQWATFQKERDKIREADRQPPPKPLEIR